MAARKKASKKSVAKKRVTKPAAKKKPAAAPKPAPAVARPAPAQPMPSAPAGTIRAEEVNLGHLMALRPRIHVGFKPSAFGDAKRALADERYATIEDAARAVAEKAVEISNEYGGRDPFENR